MIGVIVHWENAVWINRSEDATRKILKYYTHTLKAFGHSRLILVDVDATDPIISDAEIDSTLCATLDEAMSYFIDFTFVYVENLPTAQNLRDFIHPVGDVCYIIGSDYGQGLTPRDGELVVRISTEIPLWSHVALAIVLNDRKQKNDTDGN